jgi:GTP pyrophosphokinase
MDFKQFLKAIPHQFKPDEQALLEKAFEFARRAQQGQKRVSGEDYIVHPTEAAIILGKIFPDVTSLVAVLLHDVTEDTKVTLTELAMRA